MEPPKLFLRHTRADGRSLAVEDRLILNGGHFLLHHYPKAEYRPGPRVLVVAPWSGHFGWLMRDALAGLLPRYDPWLLEWKDAADIPLSAGRLAQDSCILAIMAAIRICGPGSVVLGVSQAPVAILAATALMAAHGEPECPAGLILMGGFVDTRDRPTAIERMTARLPPGWFTRTMAERSASGRPIYPGRTHAQALARYLARHRTCGGELSQKAEHDDGADPRAFPFLRLYSTLMDLPAEFAEDNARQIFAESRLARGVMSCRGRLVEPHRITATALMTIEGGADDSSGPGHTHAAHALCPSIPGETRERWTEPGAGHFGLFHGEPWRSSVLPRINAFIARITTSYPSMNT